jgi:hypothetical protein
MKHINFSALFSLLACLAILNTRCAQPPVFPVKVSENGRYITDQNGQPVFWLGTTQWQIFREYTLEEATMTIENVKNKGFIFIQAMLMGVGDGTQPNLYGEKPWINDDPLTPNEAYFLHVFSNPGCP